MPAPMRPQRVYRLSPRRRALLLGAWALLVVPLLVAGVWMRDWSALAAGASAGVLLALVFAPLGWWTRLVLNDGGVVRHDVGYRLATSWENIAELRRVPASEGFVLRRPMTEAGARCFAAVAPVRLTPGGLRLYPPDVLQLVSERRFIPIEAFAFWLTRGDLAQEIARHAPWLARPRN